MADELRLPSRRTTPPQPTDDPPQPPIDRDAAAAAAAAATQDAGTDPRDEFDDLAGTTTDADPVPQPHPSVTPIAPGPTTGPGMGVEPEGLVAQPDNDDDAPDDAAVAAVRGTTFGEPGPSSANRLRVASEQRGSVTCPNCGATYPLSLRFVGGILPCFCGRNIEVAAPKN